MDTLILRCRTCTYFISSLYQHFEPSLPRFCPIGGNFSAYSSFSIILLIENLQLSHLVELTWDVFKPFSSSLTPTAPSLFLTRSFLSIQYMRHLHEKVHKLDERTAPPAPADDAAKEAAEIAASIYGAPLMMMGNEMLMLQNGSAGYSKS